MLTPRPRDEIEAQYAKAWVLLLGTRRDGGTATTTQIVLAMTGVHDALAWVLGRTPWAPLSGRDLPDPGPAELLSEHADFAPAHRSLAEIYASATFHDAEKEHIEEDHFRALCPGPVGPGWR